MKKSTTITKEYNEDGKIIKETTIIIEEDDYSSITPITIPYVPLNPQPPFNPITPTQPCPTVPWWTTTCNGGKDKK